MGATLSWPFVGVCYLTRERITSIDRQGEKLARRQKPPPRIPVDARIGQVVETVGRRVRVRDAHGDRVCFLSGQRAVIGDRVQWVEVQGSGGKLVNVLDRDTVLCRRDLHGKERVLAANLCGIVVVCTPDEPEFRAGLLDRYVVAARSSGLDVLICVNKVDLSISESMAESLRVREQVGLEVLRCSARTQHGLDALKEFLAVRGQESPWAFVGQSGVGKTSLIQALLPDQEVGPVGEISSYWGTGQHTTTQSTLFALDGGGQLVDSPGIRTFSPGRLTASEVRDYFSGIGRLTCRYRDCLHREHEDGCVAEDEVDMDLLGSYRRLVDELVKLTAR